MICQRNVPPKFQEQLALNRVIASIGVVRCFKEASNGSPIQGWRTDGEPPKNPHCWAGRQRHTRRISSAAVGFHIVLTEKVGYFRNATLETSSCRRSGKRGIQ